jgi:hypothetical protein
MEKSNAVGTTPTMKDLEIRLAQLKVPDPLPVLPTTKLDSEDDGDDDDLEDEDHVEEFVSRRKKRHRVKATSSKTVIRDKTERLISDIQDKISLGASDGDINAFLQTQRIPTEQIDIMASEVTNMLSNCHGKLNQKQVKILKKITAPSMNPDFLEKYQLFSTATHAELQSHKATIFSNIEDLKRQLESWELYADVLDLSTNTFATRKKTLLGIEQFLLSEKMVRVAERNSTMGFNLGINPGQMFINTTGLIENSAS